MLEWRAGENLHARRRDSHRGAMDRTNQAWIRDLGHEPGPQQQAMTDLRHILLRGLRKSFGGRSVGDDVLEDVIQESLIKIVANVGRFEGRSRFVTWAMSIAVRTALTELRKRHWKDVSLEEVTADANFVPESAAEAEDGPARRVEQKAVLEAMRRVIATRLSEKQRRALQAELRGMPLEEIARRTNSNRNAIYKLTHDARKRLREGLEAAGYGQDEIRAAFD